MNYYGIYGIYGRNGVGIYTDYSKICESRKYVKSHHIKKFNSYEDAEDWIFSEAPFPIVCDIPEKFEINRITYFKNIT